MQKKNRNNPNSLINIAVCALLGVGMFRGCGGQGEGEIRGRAYIPMCDLDGEYNLRPTFYGANREGRFLTIRIEAGGGASEYLDSLVISIDNTDTIAQAITASTTLDAEGRQVATFPVGPSGWPGYIIHALFSPNASCYRNKVTRLGNNVGLTAYSGEITFRSIDQGYGSSNRVTEVTALRLHLSDPRPIGSPAPFRCDPVERVECGPDQPVGPAWRVEPMNGMPGTPGTELNGWFRFTFSRSSPSQFFPYSN